MSPDNLTGVNAMFFLLTYLASQPALKSTLAPYLPHAECSPFDRFMNRLFFSIGLIRSME